MASPAPGFMAKIGMRVEVTGKGLYGKICYVGMTAFAAGKWIGVALDGPKGKNDGTVQGKRYFDCEPNHGIFVRQTQLTEITESPSKPPKLIPPSSGLRKPGFQSASKPSGVPAPRGPATNQASSQIARPSSPATSGLRRPTESPKARSSGLPAPGKITPPKDSEKPQLVSQKPIATVEPTTPAAEVKPTTAVETPVQPPTPVTPVEPPAHKVIAQSEELLEAQRKLIEKDKAVVDLEEKLNVLKQKRIADQAKIKEIDKIKMQNQQLMDYKAKWQESTRELQNQIKTLQNEARDSAEKMAGDDDLVELQEAVEMATLDKEMAEEKYESLQQEHESLKEHCEEVTLELEILKNEISEGGVESVAASAELKQTEQQNVRLKEALVKLKEIAQNDKAELVLVEKQKKEMDETMSSLSAERDKLKERLTHAESQVDELKEQVDFALGAEEMVEKLTDKNLELEEKIEQQEETIQDLEALRELNAELEESHVMTEHDLREELDMADQKIRESERQIAAHIEQANDYQQTIGKFRELVQNLQNRIKELHNQSLESSAIEEDLDTTPVPEIDFKTKFAQSKQYGRIIELELNKYEVEEAHKMMSMINSYLPDHFTKRGADFDSIKLLMLMERLKFKCQMLSTQLYEKHDISDTIETGKDLQDIQGEQASYACQLAYSLAHFQQVLAQFSRALNSCEVSTLLNVTAQFPELAAHEKILDNYIELLSKDMLDDTVSLELLEKTIAQYKSYYKLHLSSAGRDCTDFLADALTRFNSGAEAVAIDVLRLQAVAKKCEDDSEFVQLMKYIQLKNMEIKQFCRKIKRRMVQDSNTTLSYPDEIKQELLSMMDEQVLLVRYTQDLTSVLVHKHSSLTEEGSGVPHEQMQEASLDCVTLVFEKDDPPMPVLSDSFKKVLLCLSGIALKLPEGEYDAEPETKPQAPYLERAGMFKEELSSTTKLENNIEQKEQEISHLKRTIKTKIDDLSEANIRISLLEKRADNAVKEAEVKVEQMAKKLESVQGQNRERSKENEKTMDALQSDIEALEHERSEMKKKLEMLGKKNSMQMLSPGKGGSTMASLARAGVAGSAPSTQIVLKDSPLHQAQLDSQKKALEYLQTENWKLKCVQMKKDLEALPKYYVPKSKGRSTSEKTVQKECDQLYQSIQNLAMFPKVVDITKRMTDDGKHPVQPEEQLIMQKETLRKLTLKKDEMAKKVHHVITEELCAARVTSHLRDFISPAYNKLQQEKVTPVHMATLRLPASDPLTKPGIRNVNVTPEEFNRIHQILVKF